MLKYIFCFETCLSFTYNFLLRKVEEGMKANNKASVVQY